MGPVAFPIRTLEDRARAEQLIQQLWNDGRQQPNDVFEIMCALVDHFDVHHGLAPEVAMPAAMPVEQALDILFRAKQLSAPVRPGMLVHWTYCGQVYPRRISTETRLVGELQVHDPATTGALAALAREAYRDSRLYAQPWDDGWRIYRAWGWTGIGEGPSEANAWVRALSARASVAVADKLV